MTDSLLKLHLSELQGKIFETLGNLGYDSEIAIKVFMNSKIAKGLDSDFNFMQWCGQAYIIEKFLDEYKDDLKLGGTIYGNETLFWMGYLYRYWHFYTDETSKEIYKIANANKLSYLYLGYHTLDIEEAIDRLKETYKNKRNKKLSN